MEGHTDVQYTLAWESKFMVDRPVDDERQFLARIAAGDRPALDVLYARYARPLTLVFGYDLLLASGATLLLSVSTGGTLGPLIAAWIGPMLLLSALTLVVSLLVGSTVAVLVALVLWGLHVTIGATGAPLLPGLEGAPLNAVWQTTTPALLLAALLFIVALVLVPRREPSLATD